MGFGNGAPGEAYRLIDVSRAAALSRWFLVLRPRPAEPVAPVAVPPPDPDFEDPTNSLDTKLRRTPSGSFIGVNADPRLTSELKREQVFYSDQSRALSVFINILGLTLTVIFSIGAMIGAMITMYASVSSRVAEIGTLRALGFRRSAVLTAFLVESLLLGVLGGVAGLIAASFMQLATFSTTNFQTFADLAFRFTLTPAIVGQTLLFALVMGLIGGFLPSLRAARMNIVDSLRAA